MATERSNMELLGADRARFYTPMRETDRRAEARAIEQGIAQTGETALKLDAMREQARFNREMEATRKAADIAGKAYDAFEAIPAQVARANYEKEEDRAAYAEQLGIFAEIDAMSEANSSGVTDVFKDVYGDMSNLAAAYKAGQLSGSAFELHISNMYRAAAQKRPGYKDQFRQMAAQFLGTDIETNVNKRIFEFGKPRAGEKESTKYREWLTDNVAQTPDQVDQFWSMSEEQARMIAGPQMSREAALAREVKVMEHYNKDTAIYNERFLTLGKTHISGQLDGILQGSLAEVHTKARELSPQEYATWYGENATKLAASVEQIKANPRAFTEQYLARIEAVDPEFDRTKVLPETLDALDKEAIARAERILPMLTDPAFGQVLAASNTAMIDGATFDLYNAADTLVRLKALMGNEGFSSWAAQLSTRLNADKIFSPGGPAKQWLDTGAVEPTDAEKTAVSAVVTNGTMGATHSALFGSDLAPVVEDTRAGVKAALPTVTEVGANDIVAKTLTTAANTMIDAGLSSSDPDEITGSVQGVRSLAQGTLTMFEDTGKYSNVAAAETLAMLNSNRTRELEAKAGVSLAEERMRLADITIQSIGHAMDTAKKERGGLLVGMMTGLQALVGSRNAVPEYTRVLSDGTTETVPILDSYTVTLDLSKGGMQVQTVYASFDEAARLSGPGADRATILQNMRAMRTAGANSPFASVPKSTSDLMGHAIVSTFDATHASIPYNGSITAEFKQKFADREYFKKAVFEPSSVSLGENFAATALIALNTPIAQYLVPDAITVTPKELPGFVEAVFTPDGELRPLYSEGFASEALTELTEILGNQASAQGVIEATRVLSKAPGFVNTLRGGAGGNTTTEQDVLDMANVFITRGAIQRGVIKAN